MRKFIFMMAALAAMVMSAHTTEQKFFDNTYITLKGGVTALMHPGCNGYENLGHTFEAATSLQIGKWITPHWGMAIDGTNGWRNGSKFGNFQKSNGFYTVNYVTVAALAKYRWQFSKFNMVAAVGPMWIHGFKKNAVDPNDIGTKMQLEFNYDLNNKWQLNIVPELNYNFTTTGGNQPRFDSRNAWYGLMAGVTYKFGNEFVECPYIYTQSDVDKLNAEINDLRARQPEIVEKVVEKVIVKGADQYVVFFDKNSSKLSDASKTILDNIKGEVIIQGHASEEGTYARNEVLAKERATVVAEYLTNKGIKVLGTQGMGATGSRVAIIQVK